jgi:hypothetical protein
MAGIVPGKMRMPAMLSEIRKPCRTSRTSARHRKVSLVIHGNESICVIDDNSRQLQADYILSDFDIVRPTWT